MSTGLTSEPHPCDRYLPANLPAARVAARLALVSDTHMPDRLAELPPALFSELAGADLVLHAGDVGELWVLEQLSAIAPVVAVHGNDDSDDSKRVLPYQQLILAAGRRILLTHIHKADPAEERTSRVGDAWGPKLDSTVARANDAGASILVFGHMHIPLAHEHNGVLLINPGALASGNHFSRQTRKTAALLFLRDDGTPFVAHLDVARPGAAYEPHLDWDAGFKSALDSYSDSIVSPDLATLWPRLKQLPPPAYGAVFAAEHRLAHSCWAGHKEIISTTDLLAEVREDSSIGADVLRQIEEAIT